MTSIKTKYRIPRGGSKQGVLYYQVIHNRTVRQVPTLYRLFPAEWDKERENIRWPAAKKEAKERKAALASPFPAIGKENGKEKRLPAQKEREEDLAAIKEGVAWDVKRLEAIVAVFRRRGTAFTADEVVTAFQQGTVETSIFTFMEGLVEYWKELGKARTSETYQATLRSFQRFRNGRDVLLEEVDADLIEAYQAYLKEKQISLNTISFYMRILRAVYNRAVEKGLAVQQHPFRHVYTGIGKTVKRAVPLEVIRRLKRLELEGEPSLVWARDLFLFSFYTRGMSFVDMAFLRKEDVKAGVLSYRRKKTGQRLFIEWEACMQWIVERYRVEESPYLLPIIRRSGEDERRQYKNAIHLVNRKLKVLAGRLGLSVPFTMYVARHSWASIARSKRVPVSIISQGMGHDSETTTLIYLTSLDSTAIDRANRRILSEL